MDTNYDGQLERIVTATENINNILNNAEPSLPASGGTITGNLTVNGTIAGQFAHTLTINGTMYNGTEDVSMTIEGGGGGGTIAEMTAAEVDTIWNSVT